MGSLTSLDVSDIAKDVAHADVTHICTFWEDAERTQKIHAYSVDIDMPILDGVPDDLRFADLIVRVSQDGTYEAFSDGATLGGGLLNADPIKTGNVSEYMKPAETEFSM